MSGKRPNVLLITADQLRADCLGCYGNDVVHTPHLDALASRGARFDAAYAPATVCVPSRQSILTGMYPSAHGAMSNRSAVPESMPNLASSLSEAGYQTAAIGKMHFHPVYADYGFEHMRLAEQDGDGWKIDDYHAKFLRERGLADQWDLWDQQAEHRVHAPEHYWASYGTTTSELPEEAYHTTWIADESVAWLQEIPDDAPFFLWTSFIKPHHPFDPPAPYDGMYDPADVILPPRDELWRLKPLLNLAGDPRLGYFDVRDMDEATLRQVVAHYYGLITQIDDAVGRLIEVLQERDALDDTVVVFCSDHGDYLGQYGLFLKYPNVPYDALARVPLIVAGPEERIRPATEVREPVSLIDLLPTLVGMAGAEPPAGVQGVDLGRTLGGDSASLASRTVLIEGDKIHKAVRSSDYKLIYHPQGQTAELYAPSDDPYELHDLSAERPDVVAELMLHLADWLIDCSRDRHVFQSASASVRFNDAPGAIRPEVSEK